MADLAVKSEIGRFGYSTQLKSQRGYIAFYILKCYIACSIPTSLEESYGIELRGSNNTLVPSLGAITHVLFVASEATARSDYCQRCAFLEMINGTVNDGGKRRKWREEEEAFESIYIRRRTRS